MSKTVQVRWKGSNQDPDQITQYGTVFPNGEWVAVPVPDKDDNSPGGKLNRLHLEKFKNNSWFEVKGFDNDAEPVTGEPVRNTSAPNNGVPVRAGVSTFKPVAVLNDKGKPVSWKIEGKNTITGSAVPGPTDEYADEASAQVVCDGLNQVAP